ncbi:MAG: PrsW family glutamic-type intramembrane protease [Candidatus Paceibacterota bacterium]|jgi:RsiW-degrading membrane proteinase PrsW (M82 family)
MDRTTILLSFAGGILPAVLWLGFWMREARHREPRRLIVGTFFLGMASTIVAGVLEKSVSLVFIEYTTISFLLWSVIEESVKYLSAYFGGLRSRFCDDPIDPTIYLVTAALGFAAAENVLFLYDALLDGGISSGISSIVDRFVGASILHIVASGVIGLAIGLTFNKSVHARRIATYIGLFVAIILHTAFNRFIIEGTGHALWVFSSTWIGLVVVILILEKIKSVKKIKRTS